MHKVKWVASIVAMAFLAGCYGYDVDALRSAQATGDPFTQGLTAEYKDISAFEADQMHDWPDAAHFARKGVETAGGVPVAPEPIEAWDLPADKVDELASARARLVTLLDASARTHVPGPAARAQGRFDCWIEQQEENHQPDHIAACRDEFYAALEEIEAAMQPPMMGPYIVYFDFDSAVVRPDGHAVVSQAAAAGGAGSGYSVTGHADRSGPADYNLGLSLRRANAVRDSLIGVGVDPAAISVAGRGESEPAVQTPDGVPEQRNRRVEIILQ